MASIFLSFHLPRQIFTSLMELDYLRTVETLLWRLRWSLNEFSSEREFDWMNSPSLLSSQRAHFTGEKLRINDYWQKFGVWQAAKLIRHSPSPSFPRLNFKPSRSLARGKTFRTDRRLLGFFSSSTPVYLISLNFLTLEEFRCALMATTNTLDSWLALQQRKRNKKRMRKVVLGVLLEQQQQCAQSLFRHGEFEWRQCWERSKWNSASWVCEFGE